ncbi:DUF3105 domain-containing protein [Pseudonocardia sp. GCM10023141]|uniref:DUF3105 domain-containing protein n=1 Tax=Pseudonocardia sp. GCM10023141 TaxID=3252653 RepID=UPI00360D132E
MASGKNSKAVRNARAAVVHQRSTPWALIAAILVVVLFAGGVVGYYVVTKNDKDAKAASLAAYTPSATNQDPSTKIQGVVAQKYAGGQHIDRTVQVAYTHSPPFGGSHDYAWASCNGVVYPTAVRSENLVHSLEHGAVWIAYNPDQVTGGALDTLKAKVTGQQYTVMSPYPGLDQPISLQSWGHQLKLSDANDPRIDEFISALRLNTYQFPEPRASCNETDPTVFSQDNPPPFVPAPAPGAPGAAPEVSADAQAVVPDAGAPTG